MNLPTWVNWTNFLTAWGVLWALATALQGVKVPWLQKACHVVLAISPADFMKAIKTIGAQAIPPTLGVLCLVLLGCGSSKAPAQDNSQQIAQQEVQLAEQAWIDVTNTCLTMFAGNEPSLKQCAAALQPVHDVIVEARVDVQIWGDAQRQNWPCALTHVAQAFAAIGQVVKLPQGASDLIVIANHLALCAPDGGH